MRNTYNRAVITYKLNNVHGKGADIPIQRSSSVRMLLLCNFTCRVFNKCV